MSVIQVSLVATALIDVCLGLYVIRKSPRCIVHQSFFLTTVGIALFVCGFALLSTTGNFLFDKAIHYGALTFVFGFVLFSYVFPRGTRPSARWWLLCVPLALTALFIVPFDLIVKSVTVDENGLLVPIQGPLTPAYAIELAAYIVLSIAFLARNYLASTGTGRIQIAYLFLGLVVFMLTALIVDAVLPAMGITQFNVLGPLSSLAFVGFTAYAIVRHELLDVRVVIQRGLIYTCLFGVVVGTYLFVVHTIGYFFGQSTNLVLLSAGVTTMIGIFGVPIIERYFRRATNKIFFKDTYNYAETLHDLSEVLHSNLEFSIMEREATAILEDTFHPEYVTIERSGEISLGKRRSGDPYTPADLQLIRTFSHQAAIAFERARLFDEVKSHASELERKVNERTHELRTAQASLQQMLLDIAHNLQTPLAIFQTKIERLKKSAPTGAEVFRFESSLASLSTFIYDLLKLAKLEHHGVSRCDRVDLSALVRDVVEEISVIAQPRGIEISSTIEDGLHILGEERYVREACMNIASNALKYMKDRPPRGVDFALSRDGTQAHLCIKDSGSGIAPEDLPNVFRRFSRVQRDGTIPGNGLGLPITKGIVESHGGSIEIRSVQGEYTEVSVRLPLEKTHGE